MAIWHQSASRAEHSLTHLLPPLFALMGRHPEGGRWVARWVFRWVSESFCREGPPAARPRATTPATRRDRPRPERLPGESIVRKQARHPCPDTRRSSGRSALAGAQGRDRQRNDRSHDASAARRRPRSRPPAQRPQPRCLGPRRRPRSRPPAQRPQRRCLGPRRRPRSRPAQKEDIHTCRFPFRESYKCHERHRDCVWRGGILGHCPYPCVDARRELSRRWWFRRDCRLRLALLGPGLKKISILFPHAGRRRARSGA